MSGGCPKWVQPTPPFPMSHVVLCVILFFMRSMTDLSLFEIVCTCDDPSWLRCFCMGAWSNFCRALLWGCRQSREESDIYEFISVDQSDGDAEVGVESAEAHFYRTEATCDMLCPQGYSLWNCLSDTVSRGKLFSVMLGIISVLESKKEEAISCSYCWTSLFYHLWYFAPVLALCTRWHHFGAKLHNAIAHGRGGTVPWTLEMACSWWLQTTYCELQTSDRSPGSFSLMPGWLGVSLSVIACCYCLL